MVEMMVVISLVALTLGLAAPSLRNFLLGQQVKLAVQSLVSAAQEARSEAVKRNTEVALVAAPGGWAQGWTVQLGTGAQVLSRQDAYAGVAIRGASTRIGYGGSGRLNAAVSRLEFSDEAQAHLRCLSFDLSGLPHTSLGACP